VGKWLDKPKNCKLIRLLPLVTAGGKHLGARHAFEASVWNPAPDCANEARTQQVTGSFASNQADPHATPA
jgi:hypothetical protein